MMMDDDDDDEISNSNQFDSIQFVSMLKLEVASSVVLQFQYAFRRR